MEVQAKAGQGSGGEPQALRDETWETIVDDVLAKQCTPFLGAGIGVPHLPRGAELATALATQFDYPLDDTTNLARVTQYIASTRGAPFVKRRVQERIREAQRAAGHTLRGAIPENYVRLANLGFPLYLTTNYDDYLERAVAATGPIPNVQVCRWSDGLVQDIEPYANVKPLPDKPTIFHLHGHASVESSILVTEDDYIDFTVSLAQRNSESDPVVPHFVRRALATTNIMFIGYSLEDWNFRVLMRYLMKLQQVQRHNQAKSVSIQLTSTNLPPERLQRAENFLETYLNATISIDVYWGDAGTFLAELQDRIDMHRSSLSA